jgi:hypothetical protein
MMALCCRHCMQPSSLVVHTGTAHGAEAWYATAEHPHRSSPSAKLGSIRSFAELSSSVGVSMRFSTRSGRLPLRSRLDLKLAAAAGPNTPDLHAQMVGGDTGIAMA